MRPSLSAGRCVQQAASPLCADPVGALVPFEPSDPVGAFGPLSAPHDNRFPETVGRRRGIVGPLGRRPTCWGPFPARWAGLGAWLALWADPLGAVCGGDSGWLLAGVGCVHPRFLAPLQGAGDVCGARTGGVRCARPPATLWDPYRSRGGRDRSCRGLPAGNTVGQFRVAKDSDLRTLC